ncbi:Flp pilus assembly protein CpaB [Tardibacter chloracetimidivorans]|uniref:Flp pilus assembly protein CpaB n=1 Tax=Tardibacter chloracetimidivorans TaxID=1921510 RepID=A0A1L3ZY94_9SPHN|nr:Flp pilus assembly protein CpaB [Tardibacter chloracetimidivorans]API60606.1 Flp pilus assembly protein CpaB [Tardibacter chloracetimidivorans]
MARGQSLIILGVAILLGLAAVFIAMRWIAPSDNSATEFRPQGLAKIVVARVPLDMGTPITEASIKLIDYPASALPAGAFTTTAQLTSEQRVALNRIEANEPILLSKLSGKGGRASISALLDPEKRAASVRVNDMTGVGGFVLPGDRVDVLITRTLPGEGDRTITDILLQNIRVLGIDQQASENTDKPVVVKTATLEVSQLDSQKLALAQQVGSLSLALRHNGNMAPEPVRTVSLNDLRDGSSGALAAPAMFQRASYGYRPRARRVDNAVTIVRGLESSKYSVGIYSGN